MRRNDNSELWDRAFEEEVLGNPEAPKVGWLSGWRLLCRVATLREESAGAYSIVPLTNPASYTSALFPVIVIIRNATGKLIIHNLCLCFVHTLLSIE